MTAPPIRMQFSEPAWLRRHVFKLKQASAATGTKVSTLNYWSGIAEAFGYRILETHGNRRLLTGHGVYVVAILQALSDAGVTITRSVIKSVLEITHDGARPVLPAMLDQLHLGDGPTVIEVDLSAIWLATEAALTNPKDIK